MSLACTVGRKSSSHCVVFLFLDVINIGNRPKHSTMTHPSIYSMPPLTLHSPPCSLPTKPFSICIWSWRGCLRALEPSQRRLLCVFVCADVGGTAGFGCEYAIIEREYLIWLRLACVRDLLSAGAGVCIDSVVLVYVILELGCIYIYIYI